MKKGNMTTIASVFVIAIVALGVGMGTMAWFSDPEVAAITITAGTVDLQLSKTGEANTWLDGLVFDFPAGFAPGDDYEVHVYLKNIGSSGSETVWVYGDSLVDSAHYLSGRIFITDVAYTDKSPWGVPESPYTGLWAHPGGGDFYDDGVVDGQIIFGNGQTPLTLYEFCTSFTDPTTWGYMRFYWGTLGLDGDYLLANSGSVQQVRLTFYFDETAGNEYQNEEVTFNIVFTATDNTGYSAIWPIP